MNLRQLLPLLLWIEFAGIASAGPSAPATLIPHVSTAPGITGLDAAGNQHMVSLVPLADGNVVAAYRLGYTGATQNWHFVFDASGIVAAPRRTSQQLDAATGNPGSIAPGIGRPASDGGSAWLALLNSSHNSQGGHFVRITPDGGVAEQRGGAGSYSTQICPVGTDMFMTSVLVDTGSNLLVQWFSNSQTLAWSTTTSVNSYINEQCGSSTALGQDFVLLLSQAAGLKFELFAAPGNALTPVGSTAYLAYPTGHTPAGIGPYFYAASGDDKGVVLFRGIDATGRKVQFYARYRITASGISLVDSTLQPLPTSQSYETIDANITYGGDGQFFIVEYLAGTGQAIHAHRLDFETGMRSLIGEYEDANWTNSYGPDDVYGGWAPLQDYSVATSCDGNLYIAGTLDNGAGTAQLNVFKIPVKPATCGQIAPTVTPQLNGIPSPSGWLTANASLDWNVDTHGLPETSRTGCDTQTFAADMSETIYDCSVTTTAGTGTDSIAVKRDATQPQAWTFLGSTPASSGWFTSPVTVNFTGSDATSGIATCSDPVTVSSDGANQTSPSGTCVDVAGNTSSPVTATGLNIDRTIPALVPALSAPANALGWHKSAVTVSFPGTDATPGSGIKTCSPSVLVSTDVSARSVSGTCTDIAGNSSTQTVTINLDKTPPSITITRPLNGATYAQGQSLTASFKCSDSRSGVATCVGTQPNVTVISTATPGSGAFSVDAADRADNTSNKTSNYTILPASFALSPASLSFGNVTAGLLSQAQVITLTNTGQASLPLSSIKVTGTHATHFALTHSCPSSIAAGSTCPISVSFKPSSGGAKVAAVTVTMNAGDAKVKTVSLTGTGVAATYLLSPTSINFGAVAVGNASSTRTVVLTNTGSVAMPIKSILLTGTNPGDFVSGHTCGTEVPVGGNCQINVSFQPASGGSKTAKITMTPGAGASAKSVSLSGMGSEPPISSATPLDIPTGAASEEMAFDGANLWVANPYSQSVSKIRVADGTLLANIGISPFPRGIAFDGTDIWVTTENDNRIHRMRTSDGAVTLSANVGGYPIVAVYAGGYIWTVNHTGHSVSKVARNGTVIGTYSTVSYPFSATTDGTYLYVASSVSAEVTKLSLTTATAASTLTWGTAAGAVSFDGANLWKVDGDSVLKIDPTTGNQLLKVAFGQTLLVWPQNLLPVSGAIWLADYTSGKIRKLSLNSGAVLDEISQQGSGPMGLALAGGHLWIAMGQQGKVVRY